MLIDTHLHLDEPWLKSNEQHRKTIEDINANKIMAWGQSTDVDSYERVKKVAEQSEYIFPSFGVLLWYAYEYVDRFDEVRKLAEEALMMGEVGLVDGYLRII